MTYPRTIVAATDFSDNATHAVLQAAHLARSWHARLVLLHVFNDSVWRNLGAIHDWSDWTSRKPIEIARTRIEQLGERLASEYAIQVWPEVRVGRASQQIIEVIASTHAELLVVGEHGENWIKEVMLGGTALKVLEESDIPVLLVRNKAHDSYRDIVVATDFSQSAERATRMSLACFPDARLVLIHAWIVPFEASMRMGGAQDDDIERYRKSEFDIAFRQMEKFVYQCLADDGTVLLERLVLHGLPESAVFQQVHARSSDLIVVGKHSGRNLDERLLGSVTQNILYRAECDVLLVP
ncbi:MAG: universal stress protein [Sideroxydans sp.]|nr:universal stress protein [Sideroxydans sp.]